jgi:hypothetical protein
VPFTLNADDPKPAALGFCSTGARFELFWRSTADFASNLLEKNLIGGKLIFWHWKLNCTI